MRVQSIILLAILAISAQSCTAALNGAANARSLLQDPVAPVNSTALVNSTGPITFEKVSVGVFATCAISTGPADLYCMGDNDDGIIGDGTFTWRQIPTKSSLAGPWRDVTAGDWHACGTKEDNTGYCWGYNGGRLGLGLPDPVQANTPQKLFSSWKTVSAGHFHSCAIRIDGLAFCWGNNKNGRLGIGSASGEGGHIHELGNSTNTTGDITYLNDSYEYTPLPVTNGNDFDTIMAKGSHTCGLKTTGVAYCFGGNGDGELGQGDLVDRDVPTALPGTWKQIAIGLRFSCAINMEDDLYCWGKLAGGNDVEEDFGSTPKKIGTLKWKTISGGMQHACGLLLDSTARCFGLGWHGQLGNGLNYYYTEPYAESCPSDTPCEPKGGGTWKAIAAGEYNSCGIKNDSALYCFGENPYGNMGTGTIGGFVYNVTRVLDVGSPLPLAPGAAPMPAPMTAPIPAPVPSPASSVPTPAEALTPEVAPEPTTSDTSDADVVPVMVTPSPSPLPSSASKAVLPAATSFCVVVTMVFMAI